MAEEGDRAAGEGDGAAEERILAAAHAVFVRRGTYGARMQEIAREAGVNKALLHYYFRSKERLAEAVFERVIGTLMPRIYGILGGELPIEDKVRALVRAELEFLARHPYLPGYAVAELNFNPDRIKRLMARRGAPPLHVVRAQLEQAAAEGRLLPMAPEEFMVNVMSLVFYPFVARPLLAELLGMDDARFDAFVEERRASLADFILRGMRP